VLVFGSAGVIHSSSGAWRWLGPAGCWTHLAGPHCDYSRYSQTAGSPMAEITQSHLAKLKRIVAEMEVLIADFEARTP
jgi:hypothetical protein